LLAFRRADRFGRLVVRADGACAPAVRIQGSVKPRRDRQESTAEDSGLAEELFVVHEFDPVAAP
jgi:hypothetical protein